jgi:acyl-CoA synthetase (AMP-forming)/AMP-acid ligase II
VVESSAFDGDGTPLLQECRKKLPGYMVPQEIHFEKAFKLTANGKIDRSFIKQKWIESQ